MGTERVRVCWACGCRAYRGVRHWYCCGCDELCTSCCCVEQWEDDGERAGLVDGH